MQRKLQLPFGDTPSYRFLLASLGQLGKEQKGKALMEIVAAGYDHYARHRPPWFGLKDFEHTPEGLRKAWLVGVAGALAAASSPGQARHLMVAVNG